MKHIWQASSFQAGILDFSGPESSSGHITDSKQTNILVNRFDRSMLKK